MNLLVINQFASIPKYTTGAGERFYYLSKEFKKYGINTTVIAGGYNHLQIEQPNCENLFNYEKIDNHDYIWVRLKKYSAKSMLGRVISLFEFLIKIFLIKPQQLKKYDVILVSSMSIFPIYFALYMKVFFKTPFVLEVRDIWPLTPIEVGGYSKYNPFMKLIEITANIGYKYSDYVVSVLPSFDKFLKDNGNINKKFKWIPNGISLNEQALESKTGASDNFILVYTGAIGTANAMEYLIKASNLIKEEEKIEIWILGEGPEKENLKALAQNKNIVKFYDKISKDKVQSFLLKADCCYIGWHNKSVYSYGVSANKYNDYMLAKKPILVSTNVKKDPVIISKSGIQVIAEDPKSIYLGIKKMSLLSGEKRKEYGNNGYNYVKNYKNYEKLAQDYVTIFNSLINE